MQTISDKFIDSRDAKPGKYLHGFVTAGFSGEQYFSAGSSFRKWKCTMFFYDQSGTKWDHEQNTDQSATDGDKCNHQKRWRFYIGIFICPHEQGWQRKDSSGSQRFSGRTDRLNHIIFQNRIAVHDHAHNTHRKNGSRDGSGDGHTDS